MLGQEGVDTAHVIKLLSASPLDSTEIIKALQALTGVQELAFAPHSAKTIR